MSELRVYLFGKFRVFREGREIEGLDSRKLQELFSYLLIRRHGEHPRESLAALLWGDCTTALSRKYLRQVLWQLQTVLSDPNTPPVLEVQPGWVRINPVAEIWLDVAEFERALEASTGLNGSGMSGPQSVALEKAAELYEGELLEGWYEDWCLFERERLQTIYISMLDKLIEYYEVSGSYDKGLACGAAILRLDRARERTHRALMRLYCLADDRTSALRQFNRCVEALSQELDVEPSKRTLSLVEQIKLDQFLASGPITPSQVQVIQEPSPSGLPDVLEHLRALWVNLRRIETEVSRDIHTIEIVMRDAKGIGLQNRATKSAELKVRG